MAEEKPIPDAFKKTADALKQYLAYMRLEKNCAPSTLYSYRAELEKLILFLNREGISLSQVKVGTLREYIYRLTEERSLGPNSLYKIISIFKSFFNYLEEIEEAEVNPTRKIRLPKKSRPLPKAVTEDDFKKLIYCLRYAPARCKKNHTRDALIFYMLFYCGLRRGELIALDWDDLNLGKDWLVVRFSKNKGARTIPLHPKVRVLLDTYLKERLPLESRALITGERKKRITVTSFNNLVNMWLAISGLKKKGYSTHSFRHAFATRLVQRDVNIFLVQKLMGHLSLDSTKAYVHFGDKNYQEAINTL